MLRVKELLNKPWLEHQYTVLGKSAYQIGRELNCTGENVMRVMRKFGIGSRSTKWTKEEEELLLKLSEQISFRDMQSMFSRSYSAIRTRAIKLGAKSIYKPSEETRKLDIRKRISSKLQGIPVSDWEGFKESINALVRKCVPYLKWRKAVFTRDDYTCVLCGDNRGGNLEADHYPKLFSLIMKEKQIKTLEDALNCKELWDVSNGRTLCETCHYRVTWPNKELIKLSE